MFFVGVYREAGHHMRGHQVKTLVVLQLLLCTAQEPCEAARLFCTLETAQCFFVSVTEP